MRVLAVEVHETGAHLGELADGCEPPVDVGTAAPVQRHYARQDDLAAGAGVHESTLDARLGRAVADERRVGATSDEELDRLDEQGLAGAGLARDRHQSRPEPELCSLDQQQVLHSELGEHAFRSTSEGRRSGPAAGPP